MFGLDLGLSLVLIVCLFAVCVFEFINGFHDTANAVATVIYTNSLKPSHAVVLSGLLNALGVFIGGTAVAVGIINMLPVETLVDQNIVHSLGMVFAILLTAIFWNFGTWFLAIPTSSSHTLIGSILGVGIAYSLIPGTGDAAVNWKKATDVGLSLLASPLFGFLFALGLMALLAIVFARKQQLFHTPRGDEPPPFPIRCILILTCGMVSFSHGSNDGQKGIGLMMLILIGILPAKFAIDEHRSHLELQKDIAQLRASADSISQIPPDENSDSSIMKLKKPLQRLEELAALDPSTEHDATRFELRKNILLVRNAAKKIQFESPQGTSSEIQTLVRNAEGLSKYTDYAPYWVIVMIAVSLGLGTMIGWKRIVVTVGEKIGKTHLTYAQGASAEMVAASTIAVSTYLGLPVSTTHVLSSGIAGAMFASGGIANLEKSTITKILLAWFLTFPVCLTMSGTLFLLFRTITG